MVKHNNIPELDYYDDYYVEPPNRWPWYVIMVALFGAIFTTYMLANIGMQSMKNDHEEIMRRLHLAEMCYNLGGQDCLKFVVPDYIGEVVDDNTTDIPEDERMDEPKVCKPGIEL